MYGRHPRDDAHRNEPRPTLPPIRDLFGDELSLTPQPSSTSHSPRISFSQMHISERDGSPPTRARSSSHFGPQPGLLGPGSQSTYAQPSASRPLHHPSTSFHDPAYERPHPFPHPYSSQHHTRSRSSTESYHDMPPYGAYYPQPGTSADAQLHGVTRSHSGSLVIPGRVPESLMAHRDISQVYHQCNSSQVTSASSGIDRSAQGSPTAFASASKYECNYCGKGFSRPSSLKIHLNSHTGEKPFLCTFEGCGRSFSVLSNMRRHARVHAHASGPLPEGSHDESSDTQSHSSDREEPSSLTRHSSHTGRIAGASSSDPRRV
ncbi:hypothetical protein SERLA73DRAFT_72613 [Serpula lacrymans var. lacrymans S7.3]|uniref:C2H2-type domain-containing protein n=2 Tax=Serpula lacrymans var. lacrymans TaxID=341189 RepID=F8PVL0_SERL3|nr:uncharacterized protein SERLADRAFT_437149 [Serpula lacrymans var. lacrymans S7.9]EGN99827.1 hypothetical protein SERLA73DRAFT_72613 [Serpula lacrymans var. lacrymans S7.3]EGO25397.1 hypothetical protein SERLADRAFT_437149 [Serpula lacrymans var. lacrymans S7.9]